MKFYDLMPTNRKSFYGKAKVLQYEDGTEVLYSYNTPIIEKSPSGKLTRLWFGYSNTTARHIKAFCGLNTKEVKALEG